MSRKRDQSRTCCRSWRDPPSSDQATPSPSHCNHLKYISSIFPSKTRKTYINRIKTTYLLSRTTWLQECLLRPEYAFVFQLCLLLYLQLQLYLHFHLCLQLFFLSHLHYSVELGLNVELRMLCLDALQLDRHWNHFLKVTSQTNRIVSLDRPYISNVYNIPSSPVEMLVPR